MRPQDTQMASGREPEPDIVERLRETAQCADYITDRETAKEAADEIERLRAGGCARDQGTTQFCAEAAQKDAHIRRITLDYLGQVGQLSDEITRLRAALKTISDLTDYGTETATWRMTNAIHNVNVIARAALEEGE